MVMRLAVQAGLDLEYVEMVNLVENRAEYKDIPEQCELRLIHDSMPRLGIVDLSDGNRLIVRNGGEILIPRSAREEIVRTLHISHPATETMLNQTKNKIFWPRMREQLEKCYETCEACTVHRISRPQKSNEISMENLFNNFFPNQRIQIYFCEKGADNYLVMVDVMSGFFQVYKVKNKSA